MILVTGATGFVGAHLVRALAERGEAVRALGRSEAMLQDLTAYHSSLIEPLRADLRDTDAIIAACRGAETVFHVGALSAPWGQTAEFEAVNVGGTEAILAGCRRHNVRRLVHVSSPAVVFDGNDHTKLTENAPYPARFMSVYARTKKEAEDRVNAARETMKIVILRPKAVFGPGDTSLLPRLLAAAERNRLPQIGDGTNRVDLTYVENVVHALLLAKDAPAAIGRTYTITNGESPRLWEIVRHVLTELGVSANLRRVSLPAALSVAAMMETAAHVTGKEPLLTRYSVRILARTQTYDISAAERDLGYTPVVSLSEGIERTVAAFAEKAHGTASVC